MQQEVGDFEAVDLVVQVSEFMVVVEGGYCFRVWGWRTSAWQHGNHVCEAVAQIKVNFVGLFYGVGFISELYIMRKRSMSEAPRQDLSVTHPCHSMPSTAVLQHVEESGRMQENVESGFGDPKAAMGLWCHEFGMGCNQQLRAN